MGFVRYPRMNKELSSRIKHTLIWLFLTCFISLSASFALFRLEKNINPGLDSVGDILNWWVYTISGLGSDTYPITDGGKILAGVVIVTGLILLAVLVSEVASLITLTYERKEKGIIRIGYRNHIVIYGYTSLTAGVVKLLRSHFGPTQKIVLISNDIDFNPFPKEVDFIYTNPINKSTFIEANAGEAMASIILANDRFSDPDAYSLVIATGVERHNSRSVTIVEIMDDDYKNLYKEGNIEAFLYRKELLQDLLNKSNDSKLIRIIEKETNLSRDMNSNGTVDLI